MRCILAVAFNCFIFLYGISQVNGDSLRGVWQNTSLPDTSRLRAIDDLIWYGYILSKPDSAIYLSKQEYQLALRTNHLKFVASSLNMLAHAWSVKGEPVKAREFLTKRLAIESRLGNTGGMISAYTNLGNIANQQHNSEEALIFYFRSLRLSDSIHDKMKYALACDNIATIYSGLNDYTNALQYVKKSLDLKKELGDSLGIAVNYSHMGNMYVRMDELQKASEYLDLATASFERQGHLLFLSSCYSGLSTLYAKRKEYDKAIAYQEKALDISRKLENRINEAKCLAELGYIYYTVKEEARAIRYLKAAVELSGALNVWSARYSAAEALSDIYEKKGDLRNGNKYYRIFRDARDSMKAMENRDIAYREQLKYEYGRKELMEKLENEKRLITLREAAKVEKARRTTLYFGFAAVVLLALAIVVFTYNYSRQKNIIIHQEHHLLRQKFLVSQMNPHFIFNSLTVVQNYLYKNNSLQAGMYLSRFADLIRKILEFSRKEYITVEAETELLENYLSVQQIRLADKFEYSIETDEELMPAATAIPPMLAQPFVENAIEHGIYHKEGKGWIRIRLSYHSSTTVLYEIEDNGVGIEAARHLKEKLQKKHESMATAIAQERILSYRRQSGVEAEITIADRATLKDGATGVLVKLIIPCRDI